MKEKTYMDLSDKIFRNENVQLDEKVTKKEIKRKYMDLYNELSNKHILDEFIQIDETCLKRKK